MIYVAIYYVTFSELSPPTIEYSEVNHEYRQTAILL